MHLGTTVRSHRSNPSLARRHRNHRRHRISSRGLVLRRLVRRRRYLPALHTRSPLWEWQQVHDAILFRCLGGLVC